MPQIALSDKQQAKASCTRAPRDPGFSVWAGFCKQTKEKIQYKRI